MVIDNASTDDTANIIRRDFPDVDLVELTENLGFGLGNNVGISKALREGAKYILLLNQDAFMLPGSLESLRRHMEMNAHVGICSPLQCSPDAHHIDPGTYRYYMSEGGIDMLQDSLLGQIKESYRTPGLNAAIWLVRSETFLQVGGFDPLYFMYGEDDDLLERMQYHDIWFSLLPAIVAVHLRQSPPGRRTGWRSEFKRRVSRSRASLLKLIKNPGYSAPYAAALIVAHGVIRPVADLVVDRQWLSFAAVWVASLQLATEFRQIRRHTVLSRLRGPHFLDLPDGFAATGSAVEPVVGISTRAP